MNSQAAAYVIFGLALVIILAIIIVHYYAGKRHGRIEDPKYKMFDDKD